MAKQKAGAKVGRNLKSGQNLAYKAENRHGKSHIRRIRAHITRYGATDKVAASWLIKYAEKVGLNAVNSATEFLRSA